MRISSQFPQMSSPTHEVDHVQQLHRISTRIFNIASSWPQLADPMMQYREEFLLLFATPTSSTRGDSDGDHFRTLNEKTSEMSLIICQLYATYKSLANLESPISNDGGNPIVS